MIDKRKAFTVGIIWFIIGTLLGCEVLTVVGVTLTGLSFVVD